MVDKNKPLVQMDELELRRTFDSLGYNIHKGLIDDARSQESQDLSFAVVTLRAADGSEKVLTYSAEYGDGEALRNEADLMRTVRRQKLLLPGETLERWTVSFPLSSVQRVPAPLAGPKSKKKRGGSP